ncbi:hypothetical protein [Nonomuraea sp. NPDC005650]|uniref:hypothetical protein n=1 Tax=Nonomuraea sp. NPDC005650 TaxID=3157045 RepID=UPI0033BD1060
MTTISIRDTDFLIDGQIANQGRKLDDIPLDGLLLNSRMINGAFDDANPATVHMWAYPDTGAWDAERNNREFVAAMPQWKADGLNAFTVGIQGGSPQGYSTRQPWDNAGFTADGHFKDGYRRRVGNILEEADRLGLAVILDIFYHGQDHWLRDEDAIRTAITEVCQWVLQSGWQHVLIEIANEVNYHTHYTHDLIKAPRVHELIAHAKSVSHEGRRLLVSTSFLALPPIITPEVLTESDFVLLHGNGTPAPDRLRDMVEEVKSTPGYAPKPIMFNEDDHFDFDQPHNHMKAALAAGASWGYFDPGSITTNPPQPTRGDYTNGYQAVPINWGVSTETKRAFFETLRRVR